VLFFSFAGYYQKDPKDSDGGKLMNYFQFMFPDKIRVRNHVKDFSQVVDQICVVISCKYLALIFL